MGVTSRIVAASVALAIASVAASAHAQTRTVKRLETPALGQDQTWTVKDGKTALQWSEGRWGLKLDYAQPVGRQAEWKDVEAGAFFKLTPSLRVGGAFGLGEQRRDPAKPLAEERPRPQVRLETTFRF